MINMNNFVYKLNIIAVILICMWISIPFFRIRTGVIFLFLMFIVWLLTTDFKWLVEKISWDLIWILIFFITFVPYLMSGSLEYGLAGSNVIMVNFPIFFVGIFINHYYMHYKKDYKTLGMIAFFSLCFFTIGSLQTYFGLLEYPLAARELAGGVDKELSKTYRQLGIGGFGHIYSASFLLIIALYPIVRNAKFTVKNKVVVLISIISIFLMLLRASYATSLIIVILGLTLVLFVRNRLTFISYIIFSTLLLLLIPKTVIGEFFLAIADKFNENIVLNQKFIDLASATLNSSLDGQTGDRFNLYLSSFKVFLSNPLFGIYGPLGNLNSGSIGGHSGWFDLLGYYGLFTVVPLFLTLFYNFRKNMRFYVETNYYGFILVLYFLILLYGAINPILYVYEIGFVLFCVAPAIPFIPYAFTIKKKEDLTLERGL